MKNVAEMKAVFNQMTAAMDNAGGALQISTDAILCTAAASGDYAIQSVDFENDTDLLLITGVRDGDVRITVVDENNNYHVMLVVKARDEGYACHAAVTEIDHDAIMREIDKEDIALAAIPSDQPEEAVDPLFDFVTMDNCDDGCGNNEDEGDDEFDPEQFEYESPVLPDLYVKPNQYSSADEEFEHAMDLLEASRFS